MALTGTLRDFGIADILQLIGQQQKTGVLHLRNKEQSVHVHFTDGNVVKAESATRNKKDLLGNIMVRAHVLPQADLDRALEIQRRTLRRLGDILVDEEMVTREIFREMYQLQTTETLYRLFHWKDGTYEFEQQEVDYDKEAIHPIRSENVLMEGFRMVDEWPMVRKRITSYDMKFLRLKSLPKDEGDAPAPQVADDVDPFDAALGGAFDGGDDKYGDFGDLGRHERLVYQLAEPEQTVQDIIDRSRMGEFETCKSLLNLVEAGFLQAVPPPKRGKPLAGARVDVGGAVRQAFAHLSVGAAVLAGVGLAVYLALNAGRDAGHSYSPRAGQALLAAEQEARLRTAVEVFRLEKGTVPESLAELASSGLLSERELAYPYGREWFYRREATESGGYLLLPPIP